MLPKRHYSEVQDVGSEVPSQASKRRLTFVTAVRDVMKGLSAHEFVSKLETLLRSVVREEVERAVLPFYNPSPRSSHTQFESSQAGTWQLCFEDKLPSTIFTGSRIESEDSKRIRIVIGDAISGKIITSGPLSSIKIEIVVLDGDFGADNRKDWTEEEFNANVVRQREGKRPLVTGELVILLKDGVGYIGDVSFTDNSSWTRSRRFRLGARVVSISTEVRIKEARSEAFVVKDHRGKWYKKHHPPKLDDDIWRLERIAKDGKCHKRLASMGISTVKDFLQLYYVDPSSLRTVIGGGISKKKWDTIIEHATACVLDDKLYTYHGNAEKFGLLFNSVFNVVGVTFDGQSYQSLDNLNALQTSLVENLRRHAYKNMNDFVPLDAPSVVGPAMLSSTLLAEPYSSSSPHLQYVNYPGVLQDQLEMQLPLNSMTTSPPYSFYVQDSSSRPEVSVAQLSHPMQVFDPTPSNGLTATDSCSGPYGHYNSQAGAST